MPPASSAANAGTAALAQWPVAMTTFEDSHRPNRYAPRSNPLDPARGLRYTGVKRGRKERAYSSRYATTSDFVMNPSGLGPR